MMAVLFKSASFVESENLLNLVTLGATKPFLFPLETEDNCNNQALISVLNYF